MNKRKHRMILRAMCVYHQLGLGNSISVRLRRQSQDFSKRVQRFDEIPF
jgi:hypothetical protein